METNGNNSGLSLKGTVRAICISDRRGIEKHSVEEGHFMPDFGIEGDAHGGKWHRQVSLLSYDKVKDFNERGANVIDGFPPPSGGNPPVRGNRGTGDDPDRQGVPQPLRHL